MTKKELAIRLAEHARIATPLAIECVDALMQIMAESFERGHNITLRGFGTFKVLTRKARQVRDFKRKKTMPLPAKRTVKFILYNGLKNRINGQDVR